MADLGKRFILVDLVADGKFPDLMFGPYRDGDGVLLGKVNPTNFTPYQKEDPIRSAVSISGYRQVGKVNNVPESCKLSWNRVEKKFHDSLKIRADSGHLFRLIDHNGRTLDGRIKDFEFDEITATVPSAYKGGFTLEGIGSWQDPLIAAYNNGDID